MYANCLMAISYPSRLLSGRSNVLKGVFSTPVKISLPLGEGDGLAKEPLELRPLWRAGLDM